jgi:hypothetical protein
MIIRTKTLQRAIQDFKPSEYEEVLVLATRQRDEL